MQMDRVAGRQLEEPLEAVGGAQPLWRVYSSALEMMQWRFFTPALQGSGENTRDKIKTSNWLTNVLCDPGDVT